MAYLEKNFQTDFSKWVKNIWGMTGAFELKVIEGTSLPFSAVKDHQVAALQMANNGGLGYKLPDDSIGQKPFDYFYMARADAFVVIMFRSKDRGQKEFFMIPVNRWNEEIVNSKRKSLTEDRAGILGIRASLV